MWKKATVALALLAAVGPSTAWAVNYNINLGVFGYGILNQNDPGITNGPVACGPTSVINSFTYLQNRSAAEGGDIAGLIPHIGSNTFDQDAVAAVNALGGMMGLTSSGVGDQNFVTGKINYLANYNAAHPQGTQIVVEAMGDVITAGMSTSATTSHATPTLQFIKDQIVQGQDVELGFNWGNGGAGGHWVTLTGLHWNDVNNNNTLDGAETASFDLIDPFGFLGGLGNAVATTATVTNGTASNSTGHLVLSYTGGGANNGNDPDNSLQAGNGYIDIAVAESPSPAFQTPEPASLGIVVFAGATLLMRRRSERGR